jgi:hypothetical protein
VASGAAIDTSALGMHSFTVTGTDSDGGSGSRTVTYTVAAPSVAPAITGFAQSARRWREANKAARLARASKPPTGTEFTFALNEPAVVTLTFTQHRSGRTVRHHCLAANAHNRHKPACMRAVVAGTVTLRGRQGKNGVRFYGRLPSGRKLRPGRYTVVATARAGGRTAASGPLSFTIARGSSHA